MSDVDQAFYDAAMAEAETFVAAGYFGPPAPLYDEDLRQLEEARAEWARQAAMADRDDGFVAAGYFGPQPPLSDEDIRQLEEAETAWARRVAALGDEGVITAGRTRRVPVPTRPTPAANGTNGTTPAPKTAPTIE